jgi:hypothetical protein
VRCRRGFDHPTIPQRLWVRGAQARRAGKRIGNPDIGRNNRKAAIERAERFRPVLAETAHLSTQADADELNCRASRKPWHAMQVHRARRHLGF